MLPLSITIQTPRCILRRFSREDIPFVFSASQCAGFCDGMKWNPPASEEELIEPYNNALEAWNSGKAYLFTIDCKHNRKPLGRIVIRQEETDCWTIGYWIHPERQGHGYMTESATAILDFGFKTLSAVKISASHAVWNIASRKVLEKIGMKFVTHAPQGFLKNGKWVAEDILEISKEKWEQHAGQNSIASFKKRG
jgi:ribosomal-protein-alanine N-acetyltransferase